MKFLCRFAFFLSLFATLSYGRAQTNPSANSRQSNVDRLSSSLDSLAATASVDNWKVSPDLGNPVKGDPTSLDFDDSLWDNKRLGDEIDDDSCWIRKAFVLPDSIFGRPVEGKIGLLVTLDNYGYMWINGESKGYFPFTKEFVLTDNARPGMRFVIAIKAVNGGAMIHLLQAELRSGVINEIPDMMRDVALSFRVGQKILSFDTYQTNARVRVDPHIDKSKMDRDEKIRLNDLLQKLAGEINVDALKTGDDTKFVVSVNSVRPKLKPISEFVKQYTLYFVSNAHIDAAWLWRYIETVQVCRNTFASVLHMMDARPDLTYAQSAAAYYNWMEENYPDVFNGIKQRVKDGRWEVVGGMWIEPDCNLPSGESWMHQLLYSQNYFKKNLGVEAKIGWNPDSFGYDWNMPEFYRNAGIDAFITQKIGWNETDVFPYRVFWWESPDGSRILSYFPFDYVNEISNPYRLVDWLRQFEANTGFADMMVLFGVGDHGGGPSLEMMERIDRLKTLDIYPKVEFGTVTNYLKWLKSQDISKLPVWDSELYLEYHQGTFTTQSETKKSNRKSEVLMTTAEKFSTVATIYDRDYNNRDLETAWRDVMFNQFHDILPGSGIRENYIDAAKRYKKVNEIGKYQLDGSLERIEEHINTSAIKGKTVVGELHFGDTLIVRRTMVESKPIVVFNPLSWSRTDVVKLELPPEYAASGKGESSYYSIFDSGGREVPSQIVQKSEYSREIIFVADSVPSLGYKVYELRDVKPDAKTQNLASQQLEIDTTFLENQFYRVVIDPDSGWVKNIYDKRNKREVLTGEGNRLQFLEDNPKEWDAWNIGFTGVEYPSKLRKVEVVEKGPVRVVLRVCRDFLRPGQVGVFPTDNFPSSFFNQDIILYNGVDRVDFGLDADWWETHVMLKVAFPLDVQDSLATYEIPYGSIVRHTIPTNSWERAKFEVPAERWADMSNNGFGVSLLNQAKYGYDTRGSTMRLSLLRSPVWPDPTADRGEHEIKYAIYSHDGTWKDGGTVHQAYQYNYPLIAFVGTIHKGDLPLSHSFIQLTPSNLVLTIAKVAERSNAWVIQWYEAVGKDSNADLVLPMTPKKVVESSFLEDDGNPVPFKGNHVNLMTKKNSVATIKVYF
ncbi:MAG TPA: glycoside hydrolase family 38 C-terminal domain-containing protein [Candidatus Acidoferrales bacterium]|nr:glycoside hydrolase family 38 C-terminal domain-containing protein [Candidatus Acidoferrales bacterium]